MHNSQCTLHQVTTGNSRLFHVAKGYHRLAQVTTGYYMLLDATIGYLLPCSFLKTIFHSQNILLKFLSILEFVACSEYIITFWIHREVRWLFSTLDQTFCVFKHVDCKATKNGKYCIQIRTVNFFSFSDPLFICDNFVAVRTFVPKFAISCSQCSDHRADNPLTRVKEEARKAFFMPRKPDKMVQQGVVSSIRVSWK